MLSPKLVPELSVSDFRQSLGFYTEILGFSIEYQRVEEGFACLSFGDAQIMIDQIDIGRTWKTGAFDFPLGRGINLQIEVSQLELLLQKLIKHKIKLFFEPEEKWYQKKDMQVGHRQFAVQDPDGYLLRFFENIGVK